MIDPSLVHEGMTVSSSDGKKKLGRVLACEEASCPGVGELSCAAAPPEGSWLRRRRGRPRVDRPHGVPNITRRWPSRSTRSRRTCRLWFLHAPSSRRPSRSGSRGCLGSLIAASTAEIRRFLVQLRPPSRNPLREGYPACVPPSLQPLGRDPRDLGRGPGDARHPEAVTRESLWIGLPARRPLPKDTRAAHG